MATDGPPHIAGPFKRAEVRSRPGFMPDAPHMGGASARRWGVKGPLGSLAYWTKKAPVDDRRFFSPVGWG